MRNVVGVVVLLLFFPVDLRSRTIGVQVSATIDQELRARDMTSIRYPLARS